MQCPIPKAAIHTGGPSSFMIKVIGILTSTDSNGRRYFRRSFADPWEHLTNDKFPELNRALDRLRRPNE